MKSDTWRTEHTLTVFVNVFLEYSIVTSVTQKQLFLLDWKYILPCVRIYTDNLKRSWRKEGWMKQKKGKTHFSAAQKQSAHSLTPHWLPIDAELTLFITDLESEETVLLYFLSVCFIYIPATQKHSIDSDSGCSCTCVLVWLCVYVCSWGTLSNKK